MTPDEEALIVVTMEMKGVHALPSTRKIVALKIDNTLESAALRDTDELVPYKSKISYAAKVINKTVQKKMQKI